MQKIWAVIVSICKSIFSWWKNTYQKQNTKGKWRFGCLTFLIVSFICGIPFYFYNNQPATIRATSTSQSETNTPIVTKAVINTPTITATITPHPTTVDIPPILSGLTTGDLIANLEQKGFTCVRPERGELYYVRTCLFEEPEYQIRVDIYGRGLLNIDYIESGVLQYTNPRKELASAFFEYMAKLPFEKAQPQEAIGWINKNLPTLKDQGDLREKTIGDIKFTLFGIPTAYTLGIGDLP